LWTRFSFVIPDRFIDRTFVQPAMNNQICLRISGNTQLSD